MYGYSLNPLQIVVSLAIIALAVYGLIQALGKIRLNRLSKETEQESTRKLQTIVNLGSDVLVLEKRGQLIYPVWGKLHGRTIVTRESPPRTFIVPEDYKPMMLSRRRLFRRQAVLAYLADENGNLVEWNSSIEAKSLDPQFLGTVLNTEILQRLTATIFIKPTQIVSWLLAGLGIAFIIVFIVFPILGIDVSIGTHPIIVKPNVQITQPPAPPPGNYTIQP